MAARIAQLGISQAAVARDVGISQQAVAKIVKGSTHNTAHLNRLARALHTSPEYLLGDTDDLEPGQGSSTAPMAAPAFQFVTMQVALPSEAALARMFEGLLRLTNVEKGMPPAELAHVLARRLPTGLAQLQDLAPQPAPDASRATDAVPPTRAKDRPASPRSPRT